MGKMTGPEAQALAADACTRLTAAIFRLNRRLLEWGDSLTAPLGATSARWQVMGSVAFLKKPLTAPEIAGYMGASRQAVQKQLDLLVGEGLLERLPNERKRRSHRYGLTPEGRRRYAGMRRAWEEAVHGLFERLGCGMEAGAQRMDALTQQLLLLEGHMAALHGQAGGGEAETRQNCMEDA